jgi:hypothetical protein
MILMTEWFYKRLKIVLSELKLLYSLKCFRMVIFQPIFLIFSTLDYREPPDIVPWHKIFRFRPGLNAKKYPFFSSDLFHGITRKKSKKLGFMSWHKSDEKKGYFFAFRPGLNRNILCQGTTSGGLRYAHSNYMFFFSWALLMIFRSDKHKIVQLFDNYRKRSDIVPGHKCEFQKVCWSVSRLL